MIFVDTSFFFALAWSDDADHERVREVFESIDPRRLPDHCVTTNHVIFETITLIRLATRQGPHEESRHGLAVQAGEIPLSAKLARIHRTDEEQERAAFDYFKKHRDQQYSMVDCLSFVVMDKLGIREAWAVDRDFTHRFVAWPGPRRS